MYTPSTVWSALLFLVSYAAVLSWGGALRDETKNGCVEDYAFSHLHEILATKWSQIPIYLTVGWMNKSPESRSGDRGFEQILDKHGVRHQWFIHHVKWVDWTISHAALAEEVLRQFLYKVGNNLVASQFWSHSHVKLNPSYYCLQTNLKGKRKQLLSELRRWAITLEVRWATKETLLILS